MTQQWQISWFSRSLAHGILTSLTFPLLLSAAQAQPEFGEWQAKEFVKTSEIRTYSREYSTPILVTPSCDVTSMSSDPEGIAIRNLEARLCGDVDAWIATFDAECRNRIDRSLRTGTQSREGLMASWQTEFGDKTIRLVRWVELPSYIAIVFEKRGSDGASTFGVVVTSPIEGTWRTSLMLDEHPILEALKTGATEVSGQVR